MTATTTRNLAREVAEALGWERNGELWFYHLQPNDVGYYREELPDWEHDLNACARDLTREGWLFRLKEWVEAGKPNLWLAEYYNNQLARGVGHWGDTPAVAWCEAFLALCKHVDGKAGEGR